MTTHRKLTIWANYLEKRVPLKRFGMSYWECGSVHCAGGWACMVPTFRTMGLGLDKTTPVYKQYSGFMALAAFFSINRNDIGILCEPYGYSHQACYTESNKYGFSQICKSVVVARIREMAEKYLYSDLD